MRRSIDQALLDLRQRIAGWAEHPRPGIYIFVYPPDGEAEMLARFPGFVEGCAKSGWQVELIDLGQGFLHELEQRTGLLASLAEQEREHEASVRHDLGVLAERYLTKTLRSAPGGPLTARLLVNTGALATLVSYSAIGNALHGEGQEANVPLPSVLAFPGEGDERSLNLLDLRADTNYRLPRI